MKNILQDILVGVVWVLICTGLTGIFYAIIRALQYSRQIWGYIPHVFVGVLLCYGIGWMIRKGHEGPNK